MGARLYGSGLATSVRAVRLKHMGLPAVVRDCVLVPKARRGLGARLRDRRPEDCSSARSALFTTGRSGLWHVRNARQRLVPETVTGESPRPSGIVPKGIPSVPS